ncbi:oligomeric complex COG6 [Viridothelium virens]|uniref:Conserved oligomeric Golgi complex subunit 6 n=1 Tax=Viridothelium virens TaxID=1048519 RepID=A0A6A6GX69_VIRVR|nr:oligomeric complex COG6 [Viridothelium virens]
MSLEHAIDRDLMESPDFSGLASTQGSQANRQQGKSGAALSNRITSVLAGSYADLEIRDALETLDQRGLINNAETRRQLRLDVQRELIQCNGEVVQDFGKVADQLKRIGAAVENLNKCCAQMRASIAAASQETAPVLEEANTLTQQKTQVETKQHLLKAFNAHFHLSEDDLVTLTSTAEPVDDEFFRVLTRTKKIHEDCRVLLGTEDQRLGTQILEHSGKQLNAGFQKLHRWLQREFKMVDLENPQISSSLRRALRVLAERPSLFENCLDSFADARENSLSDAFYSAITGYSSDPDFKAMTKPIELFAHEPLRYVGDMLAWAHSATVSEREALEVLFISQGDEITKGIQTGIESEPWSHENDEEAIFDGRKALNQIVNRAFSGVARQIRQRIQQVIQSHEDPVLQYELSSLAIFYSGTFEKLVGGEAVMIETLEALSEAALSQFRANMRDHVLAAQNDPAPVSSDLSPPDFLDDALDRLRALMKSYDTSFASASKNTTGLQVVFSEALDPFLVVCESHSEGLDEPEKHIFAINCSSVTKAVLSYHRFASDRLGELDETMHDHVTKLIESQHRYFLEKSGVLQLVEILESVSDEPEDLKRIPELGSFKPEPLMATSQQLDDFLPSALMDATQNIGLLRDTKMAQNITEEAAARFCEDFEMVESKILAADDLADGIDQEGSGGEEENPKLRDLFPRTSAEISVLLS